MENKNTETKLWFRAKRFGWGWYPVSWQGWLITLAYAGGILIVALHAVRVTETTANDASTFLWNYLPPFALLSIIMIFICYRTGEKPRWRWGN